MRWVMCEHAIVNCPLCHGAVTAPNPIPQGPSPQELWRELHTTVDLDSLPDWEAKIPNYHCDCQPFYDEWKAANPPEDRDFFEWGVDLHNAVNRKLGKLCLSKDEAARLWGVPDNT